MALVGVDCYARLNGGSAAAAKIGFAFRYLSAYGGAKVITRSEIDDLLSHGVAVGFVYEDSEYSISPYQARYAVAQAQSLGVPYGSVLVMALDTNSPPGSAFGDMQASGTILRNAGYLAGFYGEKDLARSLQGAGSIDVAWVVNTWGTDRPTDRWNFRQLPRPVSELPDIGGTTCDIDDAPYPVGLWTPAPPAPPSPPPPPSVSIGTRTGDRVTPHYVHIPQLDSSGNGAVDVPNCPKSSVVSILANGFDPISNHHYIRQGTFSALDVGGNTTRVVIEGEEPNSGLDLTVWATA